MKVREEHLQGIVKNLPDLPGIYQFFSEEGQVIYVGKAKNLKKRVTSYFVKEKHENGKTRLLVARIADIKYMVVDSEMDALLLENNLIKKYFPKYNVLLKDDKTFPWICIKNENFPRIFSTRQVVKDGSAYFGPYASAKMVGILLELVQQLFKLRNCNLNLSEENIKKGKFKLCLEYHIGNCKGPCVGIYQKKEYDEQIEEIREILKGNAHTLIVKLKGMMDKHSSLHEFEDAHLIKEKLLILENFRSKSVIVNPLINNVDVFSIVMDGDTAYVNFLKVMNGSIIQAQMLELKKKLDETEEELLSLAIMEFRSRYNSNSEEVIVPIKPDIEIPGMIFTVPRIGDKKRLLELSEKNVKYYMKELQIRYEKTDPEYRINRLMDQMKKDLRMEVQPRHIECFDNSNFQGSYPVAAMSVFKDGRPSKKDYRHFNIKTVEGPDDFASMEEVIYRRYKRMLDEKQDIPQLIVIDGGKGQLSSALKSLEKLGLRGKINIIGIAKKLEEIFYPEDPVPLYLDKKSETLKIIQQLRDEVHRFGVTHHRKRRSKGTIKSVLSEIKGIGPESVQVLLSHFKSVKRISEAEQNDLATIVGKAKAELIYAHFKEIF
jgi:excinuclease ABC subunit C